MTARGTIPQIGVSFQFPASAGTVAVQLLMEL